MTATEMHDLLQRCHDELSKEPIFRPGQHEGFTHINYCRFCSFSEQHTSVHGHGDDCLIHQLREAVRGEGNGEAPR